MPIPPPSEDVALASFPFTGSPDTYTVPGLQQLEFRLWGAGQQRALRVVLDVTAGETLDLRVGGPPDFAGNGGWPSGGQGTAGTTGGAVNYNTGGFGLTDLQRTGTTLAIAGGGGGGQVTEDASGSGGIGGPLLILATPPGPGDPPRPPDTGPGGSTIEATGNTGGVEIGATWVTSGTDRHGGAGGGGYGGGGGGSIYTVTGGPLVGLTFAQPGRSGGSFGPVGMVAEYEPGTQPDPRVDTWFGFIEVYPPGQFDPGISVGALIIPTANRTTF